MSDAAATRCPESGVLAAFIDGGLSPDESRRVSRHVVTCDECRFVVGETARFEREPVGEVRRHRHIPWWAGATAAAALIAAVLLPIKLGSHDRIAQLQPATYRTVEARVTVLPYAPYRVTRSLPQPDDYGRLSIAASLQQRLERDRSVENLHRFGIAQLALGQFSQAHDLLAEASTRKPEDAGILSDLAAAQIALGDAEDAAENAARAMRADPSLSSAAFNWALALETLENRRSAIQAWQQYLRIDPASGWADEARQHLARLRAKTTSSWEKDQKRLGPGTEPAQIRRIVAAYPQRTRRWVLDELLPRWAEHRDPADYKLASDIGAARAATGDPFLADLFATLPQVTPDIQSAIRHFAEARHIGHSDIARATRELAAASAILERYRSPLALHVNNLLATNEHYLGRGAEALARLHYVETHFPDKIRRYPAIAAELFWVRGLIWASIGRPNEALEAYNSALTNARRGGEAEDEIAVLDLISNLMDSIADPAEADQLRRDAIRRVESVSTSLHLAYGAYGSATFAELRRRRPHVALAYNAAQSEIAGSLREPLLIAESAVYRAMAFRDIGSIAHAEAFVGEARRTAAKVQPEALRDRVLADINFVQATIELEWSPQRAAEHLTTALNIWKRWNWHIRPALAYLLRGKAYMRTGDAAAAESDFRAGITETERQRATIAEPAMRISYFERSEELFDQLTALLQSQKRDRDALEVVEHKRARTLLDGLTAGELDSAQRPVLTAAELVRGVPPNVVIVETALTPGGLAQWVITRDGITSARTNADRLDLEQLITGFRSAIARNDVDSARRDGRKLYDVLFAAVESKLAGTTIVVVPDGAFASVPFAALVAPDGRYLVEHFSLSVARSASTFVRSIRRPASLQSLLAVSAASSPGLPLLPRSDSEVRKAAALYAEPRVLLGSDATAARFIGAMRTADVIHYAGHAVTDSRRPSSSALCFAATDGSTGRLTAGDIARFRLGRAPLVILGACSTETGKTSMEGVDSLAEAFLLAGARGALATMWDVDDAATATLLQRFHEQLRSGKTPADALRGAQLSMISSGSFVERLPSSWASAQLIGTM